MGSHEEEVSKLEMMGKEEMRGDFSWSSYTKSINKEEALESCIFKLQNLPDFEFIMRAIRTNPDIDGKQGIRVELLKTPSTALYAQVIMIARCGNQISEGRAEHPWQEWGASPLNKFNVTIPEESFMTFKCFIRWFGFKRTTASLVYSPSNLYGAYKPFLLQSSFSDVKIIIGEEQLLAHKLILAGNSPVLKSMFESDMKEGRENEVVISDITSDVMKNVLSVLYTGCDKPLDDSAMALKMLFVAEKYDMKQLKHRCECKLSRQLTASNVLEFLESSDLHNAANLKADCLQFMSHNKRAIRDKADVENFCLKKPRLVYNVMDMLLNSN